MICLRFFIIVALVAILNGGTPFSQSLNRPDRIQIQAQPILNFALEDSARCEFGALKFRGGLVLSSSHPHFGGISALRIQPDGARFLALSDRAYWLRGRIVYEGKRPSNISDAAIAPVIGPDGKRADGWDTEALALQGQRLYLGVEGIDRIPIYFSYAGEFPVFQDAIPFSPGAKDLPPNQGLEALEFIPNENSTGGKLAAFSEKGLDKDGNIIAYLIKENDQKTFSIKRSADYDITDAALLPDKDILILERRYDIVDGASMRIRRISSDTVQPHSVVDGPVIVEADKRYQVDNMEAMSVHCDPSGEVVLTLMSDNNYASNQRTLLLQFTMMDK
jgi:hypothetical protein